MGRTPDQWVAEGRSLILDMLGSLDAALWPEIEARGGEQRCRGFPRVDVNHLLTARNGLLHEGLIVRSREPTRGGRAEVDVYHVPLARGNQTRIARAAARKRLLYARWHGWAVGDARHPSGFVGVAGERVVRASLGAAARELYHPVMPNFGQVTSVFGDRVTPGSLDSAAWMFPRAGGIVGSPTFVPIEVKNIREWIFPHSHQLYQVLLKASVIQNAHRDQRVAPLLVCRRKHIQTLYMAKDLGFMVVELKRQFLLPSADYSEADVEEVRSGIGFTHLAITDQADARLVQILNETLPQHAELLALRWKDHGAAFEPLYRVLADDRASDDDRKEALAELREGGQKLPGAKSGW